MNELLGGVGLAAGGVIVGIIIIRFMVHSSGRLSTHQPSVESCRHRTAHLPLWQDL